MSWKLYSIHCDCIRQNRMAFLLSVMLENEKKGEATTHREYGEALGDGKSKYRIFYAAEREGFIRQILVPKGPRKERAYILKERGRSWLLEHEEFVSALREEASEKAFKEKKPVNRACQNMVPVKMFVDRADKRRKAILARAKAKMAIRLKSKKGSK